MSKRQLSALNQIGDTIVEVLIVIIVVGTVIAGGYRIAVSSLQTTQLTQERSYALKLAEGQLEKLKAAASTNPAILTNAANAPGFCLTDNLQPKAINNGSPTADMEGDDYNHYTQNGCLQDANNGNCAGFCYYYGIKPQGNNNYLVTVRWDGPRGNKQQVQLSYRIYQ